jgi:hypothetical protein
MQAPVVLCFHLRSRTETDHDRFVFWCPHCAKWHSHSAENGHRAAHCLSNPASPFRATGYTLRCVGEVPAILLTSSGNLKDIRKLELGYNPVV